MAGSDTWTWPQWNADGTVVTNGRKLVDRQFNIVDGPSRDGFRNTFFIQYDAGAPACAFRFKADELGEFRVRITSIEFEDGSGQSWNIRGNTNSFSHIPNGPTKVVIYFSTATRKGTLRFIY